MPTVAARINCDGTDEYEALWKKVFARIELIEESYPMGMARESQETIRSLLDEVGTGPITPGLVELSLRENLGDSVT